jgi:hypothetical protein
MWRLVDGLKNLFQSLDVNARLGQMAVEGRLEIAIRRRFGHLWQSVDKLKLCVIQVFELVGKEIVEAIE